MYFRSILSGTLAMILMSGTVAQADSRAGLFDESLKPAEATSEKALPLPGLGLSRLFRKKAETAPGFQVAQAGDPRITSLEEQVRSLSGTLEELNFQILQMQEQMRKMQEDNEFRFQELEDKRSDAGASPDRNVAAASADEGAAAGNSPAASTISPSVSPAPDVIVDNGTGEPAEVPSTMAGTGEPPQTFGTITFDDKGNVTGGSLADGAAIGQTPLPAPGATGSAEAPPTTPDQQLQAQQPQAQQPSSDALDGTRVAALPATDDPEELYRNSYEFILSGDYSTAEEGFRAHIDRFPSDGRTPDAHFWLGEALLGQKKYSEAAETFLAASKDYPSSKKAPDMLLKLGISLVGLDQRDVACVTFAEIGKRYPDTSGALRKRVKQEQALASC